MTDSFKQLIQEVRQCKICQEFLPLGPRPVLQMHPDATILVVGQAPGRRVHETGLPFNDPSGDRLRTWMGISRDIFYDETKLAILPMGFCYPGTGPSGDLPPRPECAKHWRAKLLAQLTNIQLTLAIGQYAIAYHIPDSKSHKTLARTVKNWQAYWPQALPLPHPSPRNNGWLKNNPWFEKEVVPTLQKRIQKLLSLI